jgi:hypothetical protein
MPWLRAFETSPLSPRSRFDPIEDVVDQPGRLVHLIADAPPLHSCTGSDGQAGPAGLARSSRMAPASSGASTTRVRASALMVTEKVKKAQHAARVAPSEPGHRPDRSPTRGRARAVQSKPDAGLRRRRPTGPAMHRAEHAPLPPPACKRWVSAPSQSTDQGREQSGASAGTTPPLPHRADGSW